MLSDLWHFYDEHAAQARQHENLRATVTSILAGFAAAVVGFAGIGGLEPADAPAGALVIVIGVLGALLSLKHYERNRFHAEVLGTVRKEISRLQDHPGQVPASTGDLRKDAEGTHAEKYPRLVRIRLFHLWVALPLAVAAVGVVIVVVSLASD